MALILVLGALAIMAVLLTEFEDETSAELASALADRDSLKAEYIAKSGINLSRLLISAEPTIRQSLAIIPFLKTSQIPVWEFADQILGAFNDSQGQKSFMALTGESSLDEGKNLGLEGGRFDVVIVDEDSKLDVNLAARGNDIDKRRFAMQFLALTAGDQYRPLFEQRDSDDQIADRISICQSIVDWADSDEALYDCNPWAAAPPTAASESDGFYQILKPPYRRKNAPYDSLDELHLVHGVGDDFWATFVDPDPNDPRKRIMTVWGQGAVNVNTANAQTLMLLACAGAPKSQLCNDPVEMQKFLMAIDLIQGFTAGFPLFQSGKDFITTLTGGGMFGPMLKALGLQPLVFDSQSDTQKMVTTESKVFSIYADGIVPGYQRKTRVRIHEVVDFRSAPPPAAMTLLQAQAALGGGAAGAAGAAAAAGAAQGVFPFPGMSISGLPSGVSQLDPNGIAAMFSPNPGGTVIYYRME